MNGLPRNHWTQVRGLHIIGPLYAKYSGAGLGTRLVSDSTSQSGPTKSTFAHAVELDFIELW